MISVIQNFICTKKERLDVLEKHLPLLGQVFKEYPFLINYNTEINTNEVYNLYKKCISNLNFYNDLTKDWALTTLALIKEITTPYTMILCEDMIINSTKEKIQNCINEFTNNNYDYFFLAKIGKYLREQYIKGDYILFDNKKRAPYKKMVHGYFYLGQNAPHRRIALDAIYKTSFLLERLEEFVRNIDYSISNMNAKDKSSPNCYEEFYDFYNGMVRFGDLKCYIPDESIIIETENIKEDKMWDNK